MNGCWVVDYPDVPLPNYRMPDNPKPPDLLSCVYFLWHGTECMYVGQSRNLRARLRSHKKLLPGDRITWLPFPWDELLRAEQFYIWLLRPSRNYRHRVSLDDRAEPRAYPLRNPRATFVRKNSAKNKKR